MMEDGKKEINWPAAIAVLVLISGFMIFCFGWLACDYYTPDSQEPISKLPEDTPYTHHRHQGAISGKYSWYNLEWELHSFHISERLIGLNFTVNTHVNTTITENGTLILHCGLESGNHQLWHPRNTTSPVILLEYKWSWLDSEGTSHWMRDSHLYWNNDN